MTIFSLTSNRNLRNALHMWKEILDQFSFSGGYTVSLRLISSFTCNYLESDHELLLVDNRKNYFALCHRCSRALPPRQPGILLALTNAYRLIWWNKNQT